MLDIVIEELNYCHVTRELASTGIPGTWISRFRVPGIQHCTLLEGTDKIKLTQHQAMLLDAESLPAMRPCVRRLRRRFCR